MVLLPDPAGPSMAIRRGRCMRPPCFNERRYSEGLYHMLSALHRICFEWPGEALCSAALSTGVSGCSWFSFSFAVGVFFLADHWWFVWSLKWQAIMGVLCYASFLC